MSNEEFFFLVGLLLDSAVDWKVSLSRCTDIEVREKVVTEVTGCFADFSSTRVSIY